jgi:hypothetical protein
MSDPLDVRIAKALRKGGKGAYDLMINGEQFSLLYEKEK